MSGQKDANGCGFSHSRWQERCEGWKDKSSESASVCASYKGSAAVINKQPQPHKKRLKVKKHQIGLSITWTLLKNPSFTFLLALFYSKQYKHDQRLFWTFFCDVTKDTNSSGGEVSTLLARCWLRPLRPIGFDAQHVVSKSRACCKQSAKYDVTWK